jgi:macrolide-specific efflux system membrane fusion protein
MKIRKGIFFLILVIAASVAVAVYWLKQNNNSGEVVKSFTPVYGNIMTVISATGIVQPQNRLEIKPPINGRVEQVLVQEGDKVKKGDILAWMSSTERAALLDAAKSKGEEAVSYWQEVYKPAPFIAPIDGEVIVRAVEPGQTVTPATAVLVLSDRLIVVATVDETDIGKVKVGQEASISLDAYPDVKVKARIDHIAYESTVVNNVTTYNVDVLPDNVPEVFRSGMSANVNIVEQSKKDVLLIPVEAVTREKNEAFVFLSQAKGQRPVKQKVELGISDGKNTEVLSGVTRDDTVIMASRKYELSKGNNQGNNPFMPFGQRRR